MVLKGELLSKPTYTVIQTMTETGNTGVCYRAYHEIFKQDVVQKTVSLLGLDDAAAYTEPELLKRLRHKHLAEVWEAQWEPDPEWKDVKAITFVMPLYEGGSVADALADGYQFSIGEAMAVACGVLDALHYLHVEEGLLHRDVKPANILLDADRRHPYLSDLGSAAAMKGTAKEAEARSGTPLYRPTESHSGRYSARGDIYSTGLVLLECLNGRLPYEDLDRDDVDARLASGRPPVPARLLVPAPHVPPAVARLVRRMTDRDPLRRPETALRAQRALQNAVHLDWRERDDDGARVWDGRWPPAARASSSRRFEVRAETVSKGRYAGLVALTARWRRTGAADWRQFASLTTRAVADDAATLGRFFRAVEARAQKSAAR